MGIAALKGMGGACGNLVRLVEEFDLWARGEADTSVTACQWVMLPKRPDVFECAHKKCDA